jgi:hypothetical protein
MKSGHAINVISMVPHAPQDLVLQLRFLATQVERGKVDAHDVLLVVDQPEGTLVYGLELVRLATRVWKIVQEQMGFEKPNLLVVVKGVASREAGPNPNLILEG